MTIETLLRELEAAKHNDFDLLRLVRDNLPEIAAAMRDGARYRWLRERDDRGERVYRFRSMYAHHLDNAIDAARAKEQQR